ncbi:hypothetical protein ACHAXT_002561 [Thalassiosira profunda]
MDGTLERQVVEAALATTRPTSSPAERSAASASLEQWTSGACWEAYTNIIRMCFSSTSLQQSNHSSVPSSTASTPLATPSHSRQSSGVSSSSGTSGAVEQIAYATSPSKHLPNLELQIQREANGAKLLLVTLLCGKIRREFITLFREQAVLARSVYDELVAALLSLGSVEQVQQGQDSKALMGALCSDLAAVAVRISTEQSMNEGIMSITLSCKASVAASLGIATETTANATPFSPTVALRLLAELPVEAQSRKDLTNVGIDALLQMPHSDVTLGTMQMALSGYIAGGGGGEQQDGLLCLTLGALAKWAEACKKFTLSRLLETTNGSSTSILSQLVALLSSQSQQRQWASAQTAEDAIIKASKALNASIENTADFGTQSRRTAISSLLVSITSPTELLVAPLKTAESQQWEDALVALSSLASTLAREEIDEIATCRLPGCSDLIALLLQLQAHPIHGVATPVLEVWLALQDIPTSERHPSLAAPLYQQLTECILNRVAYPSKFVSWEEELDLESSDFEEMRRLCTDVLVGAYFLLRSAYLETLANLVMAIDSTDWETVEAALFCMSAVGREACARVKSANNATRSGRDSPVAADGEATSMGLTQVVGAICAGGAANISRRHPLVLSGVAAFLGSYSLIWASSSPPQTMMEIVAYLSGALSVSAATEAAGKSIRLVLIASAGKLAKAAASPGADISAALTQTMEAALSTNNANVMANVAEGCARVAVQLRDTAKTRTVLSAVAAPVLLRSRAALKAIVSSSTVQGSGQAASQVDAASQALASYLGVLRELVRFCDSPSRGRTGESHVLTHLLESAWPVLSDIAAQPSCRLNTAVLSGLLEVHSQLLSVVPSLIGPYFKDLMNFVVQAYEESHCPAALSYISAAVETFDNEESIGLIGWKHIHLKEANMARLLQAAGPATIDNLLAQHGETITKACLGALAGGAPQILWPAYSECLFSIMLHIISSSPGAADDPNSILCTWLRAAMNDNSSTANITPEVGTSVIRILCELTKEGTKSKAKAKLALMDYGRIVKGEATTDALLAYSIA